MATLRFYIGLFLITACTLMLQLIQTRILSVVAWYHLAFFVISMAMFGLTAGAVRVYLRGHRYGVQTLSYDLAYHSAAYAVTTALCLAVQMTLVPVATKSLTSVWIWVELAVCMSIPFYFAGTVVSLALTRSSFPIGRVYGIDLLGAALGCLGVIFVLDHTDGPSAVLWVAALAAVGAIFFATSGIGGMPGQLPPMHGFLKRRKTILVFLATLALANGMTFAGLQPLVVKGRFENMYTHVFREWNTFSRVAVLEEAKNVRPQMWGPSPKFDGWKVDQHVMNIDGDAGTPMYRFTGDLKDVAFLKYDITSLAYFLPGRASAAVIGVGGGRDMLAAALFGVPAITGVELNPIFVRLLTREPRFANFNQVAKLPGTTLVNDEGRSWFARTQKTFDIIQMSLIDTWAATGAGAFTLSENGLYTAEAMKIFLSRLSPKGVFAVSRWFGPDRPLETGRMLSLAVAGLLEMGIAEPRRHLFLASEGRIGTLLISRSPISGDDLKALNEAATQYGYEVFVSPDGRAARADLDVLQNIVNVNSREELERYTSGLALDLTPPTDNRPFFFNQFPLGKPLQAVRLFREMYGHGGEGGVYEGNLVATGTLVILFVVALGLVTATIVIPLGPAMKDVGGRLAASGTMYFLLIGIGFMMIEIALLQRTSVFLGHPMYALSVLLFTLILATGVGSLLSEKLKLDTPARLAIWALMLSGYVVMLPTWLERAFATFADAQLFARAMLCIATIAPVGVLMGFGFPTGMRLISAIDRRPTPWFWGINGAAGVLASIAAVATSIGFGISTTLMVGAVCYLLLIPVSLALTAQERRLSTATAAAA